MIDFTHINYLKTGTRKQQKVYQILSGLHIFDDLKDFTPVLAGTFPLGIDIAGSDLDILCYVKDFVKFEAVLLQLYANYENFSIRQKIIENEPALICRFQFRQIPVEIFGQAVPVHQQQAYRHMLIEYQILQDRDEAFANDIIRLKKQGYKTEPAFAKLLGLTGNPYKSLLKYKL